MGYGADWIRSAYKTDLSPLGEDVANLLQEWASGIYHLEDELSKVDWGNRYFITFNHQHDLATFDFDSLTYLVFLAHWFCLRVSIKPCNFRYLRIVFHKRLRDGDIAVRHPTIDQAIESFKAIMGRHQIKEEMRKEDL